jgi:hypothetical protein
MEKRLKGQRAKSGNESMSGILMPALRALHENGLCINMAHLGMSLACL